jgi:hypothetical protein
MFSGIYVPPTSARCHPNRSVATRGIGLRVLCVGFRVQGSGFRVQGSGFMVEGLGFWV